MMRLIAGILLCAAASQGGSLLIQASGIFPGGAPVTLYSQPGESFLFSIEMESNPVPLDTFPPDTTAVGIGPWTYALAGSTVDSGTDGVAFLYFTSRGGLFDLCADDSCNTTIGLAGDALISSLDEPVLAIGVYSGTDFAYYDGSTFIHFPASSTVSITASTPEPSTGMTFGAALLGVVAISRWRLVPAVIQQHRSRC